MLWTNNVLHHHKQQATALLRRFLTLSVPAEFQPVFSVILVQCSGRLDIVNVCDIIEKFVYIDVGSTYIAKSPCTLHFDWHCFFAQKRRSYYTILSSDYKLARTRVLAYAHSSLRTSTRTGAFGEYLRKLAWFSLTTQILAINFTRDS